ncbi:MAG: phage tail protein [Thermodesulfobacteriota bacterium]|nr:phage tail protein [Thermodesulfobacteriota bacterium]
MATYFALPTDAGAAKIADSIANGTPIALSEIAVGDGDHTPDGAETALVNEQWRGDISTVSRDTETPTLVKAELTIPTEDGGWWVREIGVFDAAGDLFAIAKCPPSYKPITVEGSPKPMPVRFYLYISIDANINLFTGDPEDPASIGYVQSLLFDHEADMTHADFSDGDILLCGNDTAPTGWHKLTDWQNNSMLVFTAGEPGQGGTDNPQSYDPNVSVGNHADHTHSVPTHRHGMAGHTHSVPNHRHGLPGHWHNLTVPFEGWGNGIPDTSSGRLKVTTAGGAYGYRMPSNRTLTTASGGGGNSDYCGSMTSGSDGSGWSDYSGVLTSGDPSAVLSHSVDYSSWAPKYRAVIAIRKGDE